MWAADVCVCFLSREDKDSHSLHIPSGELDRSGDLLTSRTRTCRFNSFNSDISVCLVVVVFGLDVLNDSVRAGERGGVRSRTIQEGAGNVWAWPSSQQSQQLSGHWRRRSGGVVLLPNVWCVQVPGGNVNGETQPVRNVWSWKWFFFFPRTHQNKNVVGLTDEDSFSWLEKKKNSLGVLKK